MIRLMGGSVMTNRLAFMLLGQTMQKLFKNQGFTYILDTDLGLDPEIYDGYGETQYHELGIKVDRISVTCSNSIYTKNSEDPVDDLDFMKTYVAVYHEGQHWNQVREDGHSVRDLVGTKLTVNRFSKLNNPSLSMLNYFWDPTEVDACGVGLYNAYTDLSVLVGEPEANRLCCLYENYCLRQCHHQWLGKKKSFEYMDVHDIFADYERGFQKALHHTRDYWLIPREELGAHCMRYPNDGRVLGKQKDGCKQDLMIAAIHFQNPHLDFVKQRFAAIRDLDFDMRMLFQRPKLSDRIFGPDYSKEKLGYSVSDRYTHVTFENSVTDNDDFEYE